MNNNFVEKANLILGKLCSDPSLSDYIVPSLGIPSPYTGAGVIRLIVIGQDPTVKRADSRKYIKTVLNLDRNGSVVGYLSQVCQILGLTLKENIYATNVFKNFFILPPTQIREIDIFNTFLPHWLPLLKEELEQFPDIPIITLGQPVLQMMAKENVPNEVKYYWGHTTNWQNGEMEPFRLLKAKDNILGRLFFPYPHQPSARRVKFYSSMLGNYTAYMKTIANI